MFKKNKTDYKAKLEHKLYLARENPEPIFDLSDCGLRQVPSGIYSLCRVFLKECLYLDNNKISSLTHGGTLKDLSGLKILNLQHNSFTSLPDDISSLTNLRELYLNNNSIKQLPKSLCALRNLRILDVSNNSLRAFPGDIGNLNNLQKLYATGNKHLNHLPQTLCNARKIIHIALDASSFIYPPSHVIEKGTETIMRYLCNDCGIKYEPPTEFSPESETRAISDYDPDQNSELQAKIWEFENMKKQKLEDILKFEKEYEYFQRKEVELQQALNANRQKFLTDITEQQTKLEQELAKIQHKKEEERSRLIKELQEEEIQSDLAINQLLTLGKEPLAQLLEQEKAEDERLLAATLKYNETLRKNDVLEAMRLLLEDETNKFKEYDQSREDAARSILAQEILSDTRLAKVLQTQDEQQAVLVHQLQMDMQLQRVVVGALLERYDARSWGLVQQVRLVEQQLAKLTTIEMDRRKLELDEQVNDLAIKRTNLSALLVDLLEQQSLRRAQLLATLQDMEELGQSQEDFWLIQYQRLLDRRPTKVTEVQKYIDPEFAQELLLAGVIHYLPYFANWAQTADYETDLTLEDLAEAGIKNTEDQKLILLAYNRYKSLRSSDEKLCDTTPSSAPVAGPSNAPSAPARSLVHGTSVSSGECVVCMNAECEIIFLPCGHMCCCSECSTPLNDCPLCRNEIDRKIKVIVP